MGGCELDAPISAPRQRGYSSPGALLRVNAWWDRRNVGRDLQSRIWESVDVRRPAHRRSFSQSMQLRCCARRRQIPGKDLLRLLTPMRPCLLARVIPRGVVLRVRAWQAPFRQRTQQRLVREAQQLEVPPGGIGRAVGHSCTVPSRIGNAVGIAVADRWVRAGSFRL